MFHKTKRPSERLTDKERLEGWLLIGTRLKEAFLQECTLNYVTHEKWESLGLIKEVTGGESILHVLYRKVDPFHAEIMSTTLSGGFIDSPILLKKGAHVCSQIELLELSPNKDKIKSIQLTLFTETLGEGESFTLTKGMEFITPGEETLYGAVISLLNDKVKPQTILDQNNYVRAFKCCCSTCEQEFNRPFDKTGFFVTFTALEAEVAKDLSSRNSTQTKGEEY